ncbi:hypothetical protein TNCT_567781 [Trichonephila clavata]|uniref:Uncharacterized protein n=1 Tax=Trichonephila clavata TaxID=2740835 RepID=A0A8X6J8L7_TRICU|nr:hypothetical protein TNCT_567781 [Trichonephila clavata]
MPRRTPIPCSNGTLGIQVSDRTDDLRQDLGVIRLGDTALAYFGFLLVLVSVLDWGSEVKCNVDGLNRFRYLSCSHLCIAWAMKIANLTSIACFNVKNYLEVVVWQKKKKFTMLSINFL